MQKNPPFDGDHIEFGADFLTTCLTTSTGGIYGNKSNGRSREHGVLEKKALNGAEMTEKTLISVLG